MRGGRCIPGGSGGAIVWADVVPFPGEEVFELVDSGVGAAFGSDAKETQSSIIVWGRECGGRDSYTVLGSQGEGERRRGWDVGRIIGVKVGDGGALRGRPPSGGGG